MVRAVESFIGCELVLNAMRTSSAVAVFRSQNPIESARNILDLNVVGVGTDAPKFMEWWSKVYAGVELFRQKQAAVK